MNYQLFLWTSETYSHTALLCLSVTTLSTGYLKKSSWTINLSPPNRYKSRDVFFRNVIITCHPACVDWFYLLVLMSEMLLGNDELPDGGYNINLKETGTKKKATRGKFLGNLGNCRMSPTHMPRWRIDLQVKQVRSNFRLSTFLQIHTAKVSVLTKNR